MSVKVGSTTAVATVDTGAGISIINYDLAREFPRLQQKKFYLQGLNGKPMTNFGFAIVPLTVGKFLFKYTMMIVKDSSCPVLLGYEFLESYGCTLDIPKFKLTSEILGSVGFAGAKKDMLNSLPANVKINLELKRTSPLQVKAEEALAPSPSEAHTSRMVYNEPATIVRVLQQHPRETTNHLRLGEAVIIPAFTKQAVPVSMDRPIESLMGVLHRNEKLYIRNRTLSPNLLIDNTTEYIELINPAGQPAKLPMGTKLGRIEPYEQLPVPLFTTGILKSSSSDQPSPIYISTIQINPDLTK
jgi:hypothetical protein